MQKKRKIIISIAISLGLALAATQLSDNGGLQSSILAPLQSCKNSTITSLERCKTPLTTEKTRIQKEIDALDKKIAAKKTECIKLIGVPNRSTQLTTCRAQLKVLERDKVKQVAAMKPIDLAISKLVSEAPLQANVLSLQKELDTIKTQATAKVSECNTLRAQNKTAQAATCNQQLIVLRQTQTAKQTAYINAINAFKKVAGASATTPTISTPVIPVVPVVPTPVPPVTPVTPTILHCCADSKAKNFNPTCGIAPNTNSNPALCVYPTNPGCTDSTALNYDAAHDADDGSCIAPTPLCMDSLSPTFMQPGPCQEPQEQQGCTDPRANNRDPGATVDNGTCTYDEEPACNGEGEHGYDAPAESCMTCSDDKQNGDETDVDCGGKCGECDLGCKNPLANNFNDDPEVKDGGEPMCTYDGGALDEQPKKCGNPNALNYVEDLTPDEIDESVCQYNMVCDDPAGFNFVPENERKKGDKPSREVCTYCDPAKIARFNDEIKKGEGAKVKSEIGKMEEKERECLKKEICKNTNIEVSTCTIATDYRLQYSNLQLYLALSKAFSYKLDGVYRPISDINKTPTGDDFTRSQLVSYMGSASKLKEIKNQCPFIRDLLGKELIKDYKAENTTRIKVTQMALTMLGKYSGAIDGNRDTTYNLLQKHYKWDTKKFGYAYIAGADKKWQVGRATIFGYNDSDDNGRGTPFMDPTGVGIHTDNTTVQGASLPLPVTVKMLCPNIVREINNHLLTLRTQGKTDEFCSQMVSSPDPMNPAGKTIQGEAYSGLAILTTCITNANKAGLTSCQSAHHRARVKVSSMDKSITVPLVDIGPSEGVWTSQKEATLDLTHGAAVALSGGSKMLYETCFELIP